MTDLLRFAVLGLGVGAVYVLLAQGIVLVYRGSDTLSFVHGALAMTGGYIYLELKQNHGWGTWPAMAVAVIVVAAVGALIQAVIMRRLRAASPLARVIVTLGLLTALQGLATIRYKDLTERIAPSLPSRVITIGSISFGEDRLWLVGIAVVLTMLLTAAFRYTNFGLATSAACESDRSIALLGWSPNLLATINWTLGAALAALAGILVIPLTGLSVTNLPLLQISAMAAALIGGFSSFPLALMGGIGLGIAESEATRYLTWKGVPQSIGLIVIIVVLVIRGRALPLRSHVVERLPQLGTGRWRPRLVVPAVVAAVVLILWVLRPSTLDAVSVTFCVAIVLLSIVLLTGYTGQLSLAQYALGGIGALVAGRLVASQGWPFELALVVGVLATVPVGVLFGLPALRTRGVTLAVVTLSLGVAIEQVVFTNPTYIGGINGTNVGPQSFLGVDVNAISHPDRYALLCLGWLLVALWMVSNLRRSRAGRRLLAVRTNERAAASLGVSVLGAKLYAFGLSAAIAGLGITLLAFRQYSIPYDQFTSQASISMVTIAVVGGLGYALGTSFGATLAAGAVGSAVATAVFGRGTLINQWLVVIGGVLLIVFMLQDPNGMASNNVRTVRSLERRLRRKRPVVSATPPPLSVQSAHRARQATLVLHELTVRFGGVVALDGVGFSVRTGEVLGLIGPNGAGKTTLIDAVTGFVQPASGKITLDGTAIGSWPAHRRARGRDPVLPVARTLRRHHRSREPQGGVGPPGRLCLPLEPAVAT